MKFKTFSILAGSEACNARCPFCVSKMTPPNGVDLKEPEVNWRNFRVAANLAKHSDVDTAMITSKGEPLLFPKQITKYMEVLNEFNFPFIELQTNAIPLYEKKEKYDPFVKNWFNKGLTTVAISIVHFDPEKNREIYSPNKKSYIDLSDTVKYLHDTGLSVRLATIGLDGYIDSGSKLERLIEFSKENKVEQLTLRPVNKSEEGKDLDIYKWVLENYLKKEQLDDINSYVYNNGTKLLELPHGAVVYDIRSQNFCLTNSLTRDSNPDKGRQLIFFPDGHIRYDWEKEGAILL
ncbi:MAG: radical SAM protein [Nanoarchaeota archaeon]|nr:radical SAM protein [Nanoarchaeota archaeon]